MALVCSGIYIAGYRESCPYDRQATRQSNCANVAAANPQSDKANNFAKINMRDYCRGS